MILKEMIENYISFNEAEESEKKAFLQFIDAYKDVLTRENLTGHFTASAFVVNEERTKMLAVKHKIYNSWIYPGGHADGEIDLLQVAHREVKEETGIDAKILDKNIYAIQVDPVLKHVKRGVLVPSHLHYDVMFLMEAKENDELCFRKDESTDIAWLPFEKASQDENISRIYREVHQKAIKKLQYTKND